MRRALPFLALLALVGCNKSESEPTQIKEPAPTPIGKGTTAATPSNGGGSVAPIGSGAAGGLTPMSGTDSVGGGGMAGIGQAAKNQARSAAATSSVGSMGDSEGN